MDPKSMKEMSAKEIIARRTAKELKNGMVVNLGIGLPTMVPNYLPNDVHVTLQSENGMIGMSSVVQGETNPYITDAGGKHASIEHGGAFIDSSTSFSLIRGGHIDITILGSLQVDEEGSLANWMIPGKKTPGMGGAMDLLAGVKNVIVAMEHTAKGTHKILKKCTLPLTAVNCVTKIITEMAVFDVTPNGLILIEYNPAYTIDDLKKATGADFSLSENLIEMAV